jgi:hypothetical protein
VEVETLLDPREDETAEWWTSEDSSCDGVIDIDQGDMLPLTIVGTDLDDSEACGCLRALAHIEVPGVTWTEMDDEAAHDLGQRGFISLDSDCQASYELFLWQREPVSNEYYFFQRLRASGATCRDTVPEEQEHCADVWVAVLQD